MKKGISFYFGFKDDNSHEERAKMIKDAGFDCVITSADKRFSNQNGSFKQQLKWFKKYGLELSSLHMRYKINELPEFFKNSKIGKRMEQELFKDIKLAAKYNFSCVVVHLFCKENSREIGFQRIKKALKLCEKLNVPLAIENIDDPETFKALFNELEHPYLKMCYDSGHNNFVDKDFDYFKHYGDKIICLHLHDNDGTADQHTLNKYGTINWKSLANKLSKLPNEINLDYELLLHKKGNDTKQEILNETFKQACDLENLIIQKNHK